MSESMIFLASSTLSTGSVVPGTIGTPAAVISPRARRLAPHPPTPDPPADHRHRAAPREGRDHDGRDAHAGLGQQPESGSDQNQPESGPEHPGRDLQRQARAEPDARHRSHEYVAGKAEVDVA